MRKKHDAELRDLLTSNRSDEEVEQANGRQQELVKGAAPWNKGVMWMSFWKRAVMRRQGNRRQQGVV